MATELRHNDPFPSSIFALLPQTLGRPSIAATASNDLESVDAFFRSMVVKGSTQLVHQAQTITKSIADTHNPNDESFAAKFKDHPQERRPALGRKQAKFSLKPVSSSLPNVDFSSIIADEDDPEKYYYFMEQLQNADKELHKIRKDTADQVELHQPTAARKRRPGLLGKTASYNHHISTNADIVETLAQEEPPDRRISISSNKVTDMEIRTEMHTEPIGESHISPAKNASVELQEITEGQDSQAGKGKKDSNLLEKLLYSGVDFNAEKGKTFLQQNLPMKPIHAGKICLPDLGDIQSSQHSASKVIVSHGKGSAISLTVAKSLLEARSTFQKRIPLTDRLKELYSDPIDDSPSSGDNSLFKSKTKVSHSPSSANGSPMVEIATKLGFEDEISSVGIEVGRSSGRKSISEEKHTEHSHHIEGITNPDTNGVVSDKDELDIGLQEGWDRQVDPIMNNQRDFKVESLSCINQLRTQETLDHPPQLIGINTNSDSCGVSNVKSLSGVVDVDLQMEEGNTMHQDIVIRNQPNAVKSVTSSFVAHSTRESLPSPPRRNKDHNCESLGANLGTGFSRFDEIPLVEAQQANAADPRASKAISSPSEATTLLAQHLDDILSPLEKNNKGYKRTSMASQSNERRRKARPPTQTRGKKAPRQSVADISNSLEATTSDQHIENMCSLPEENNEGHLTTSVAPQNDEERRQKTPSRAKTTKKYARRQSLAGAGMVWEDGKRRSSRHRVRPLEHWRGERLLYGRIHDTLTTVIGVKYASPGKDSLKVESYVPEQYANLVAQAARY